MKKNKNKNIITLSFMTLLLSSSFGVFPNDTYAGFEFVAPIPSDIQEELQELPIQSKTEIEAPKELEPLPMLSEDAMMPAPADATAQQVEQEMLPPVAEPLSFVNQDEEGTADVVDGFARQVPLVLAVTQIVPPSYKFVFDETVDPGMTVDWQGGKVWSGILEDFTTAYPLNIAIADNVVYIKKQDSSNFAEYFVPEAMPRPMAQNKTPFMPDETMMADGEAGPISLSQEVADKPMMDEDMKEAGSLAPVALDEFSFGEPLPLLPDLIDGMPSDVEEGEMYNVSSLSEDALPNEIFVKDVEKNGLENPKNIWRAQSGQTLRTILKKWSEDLGVSLVWAADYDYPIQAHVSIKGSFIDAVKTILDGLSASKPKPLGRLHKNKNTGKPVLVIETDRLTS